VSEGAPTGIATDPHASRLAAAIWRYRWLAALIWIGTVVAAGVYVATAAKVYRVQAVLAPSTPSDMTGSLGALAGFAGLAGLAGVRSPGETDVNVAIATLMGRQFTEDFVRAESLLPVLFSDRWDSVDNVWRGKPPSLSDAYRLFEKGGLRKILQDKRTGLITVQIHFRDGAVAARLLERMIARVNRQLRSRAITEAEASVAILNKELTSTTAVEMKQAIYGLIEGQLKLSTLARVREDYALRVIDPPVVPDANEYVAPRRAVILASAVVIGFCLSIAAVLFLSLLAGVYSSLRHRNDA
jgi:multisubunit Na+/H+ antiporter MnhC subunit